MQHYNIEYAYVIIMHLYYTTYSDVVYPFTTPLSNAPIYDDCKSV